jgi:hypothetical protein
MSFSSQKIQESLLEIEIEVTAGGIQNNTFAKLNPILKEILKMDEPDQKILLLIRKPLLAVYNRNHLGLKELLSFAFSNFKESNINRLFIFLFLQFLCNSQQKDIIRVYNKECEKLAKMINVAHVFDPNYIGLLPCLIAFSSNYHTSLDYTLIFCRPDPFFISEAFITRLCQNRVQIPLFVIEQHRSVLKGMVSGLGPAVIDAVSNTTFITNFPAFEVICGVEKSVDKLLSIGSPHSRKTFIAFLSRKAVAFTERVWNYVKAVDMQIPLAFLPGALGKARGSLADLAFFATHVQAPAAHLRGDEIIRLLAGSEDRCLLKKLSLIGFCSDAMRTAPFWAMLLARFDLSRNTVAFFQNLAREEPAMMGRLLLEWDADYAALARLFAGVIEAFPEHKHSIFDTVYGERIARERIGRIPARFWETRLDMQDTAILDAALPDATYALVFRAFAIAALGGRSSLSLRRRCTLPRADYARLIRIAADGTLPDGFSAEATLFFYSALLFWNNVYFNRADALFTPPSSDAVLPFLALGAAAVERHERFHKRPRFPVVVQCGFFFDAVKAAVQCSPCAKENVDGILYILKWITRDVLSYYTNHKIVGAACELLAALWDSGNLAHNEELMAAFALAFLKIGDSRISGEVRDASRLNFEAILKAVVDFFPALLHRSTKKIECVTLHPSYFLHFFPSMSIFIFETIKIRFLGRLSLVMLRDGKNSPARLFLVLLPLGLVFGRMISRIPKLG